MSEKMDMISKEILGNTKSEEETILNGIQRNIFFEKLKMFGFTYNTLQVIFESEIYTNETKNNLNIALRKLKKEYGIHITDSILFLEEFTRIKKILCFIDNETKWIVKNELSDKYNIELETNDLYKILG